jgi:hypothetical protein
MRVLPHHAVPAKPIAFQLQIITLRLDPAKTQLISGFIDTYLNLNESEEQVFQSELGTIELDEREEVMQIVTSWMRTGIQQGQVSMVMRQLKHKFGDITPDLEARIKRLSSPQLTELPAKKNNESVHLR